MKKLSYAISTVYVIALILFTLTFSIGLPIYVRQFYFLHIDALELDKGAGVSKEEIKDAYNELLDYLVYPNAEFSTGVFEYSEDGRSHFEDCKRLFLLNGTVLTVSTVLLIAVCVLEKTKKLSLLRRDLNAVAGGITLFGCTVLAVLVTLDFDRAFTVFHKLFFPGKDNWSFSPVTDEIINILPERFFANCAVLIGMGIVVISVILIVTGLRKRRILTK